MTPRRLRHHAIIVPVPKMRVPQEDYVILMGVTINLEVNARVQVPALMAALTPMTLIGTMSDVVRADAENESMDMIS